MIYVPHADFYQTANCLSEEDAQHNVDQGLALLRDARAGRAAGTVAWRAWRDHPAALATLLLYTVSCQPWLAQAPNVRQAWRYFRKPLWRKLTPRPTWLGDEELHRRHRELLLYQDWVWYAAKFPDMDIPAEAPE